VSGLVRVLVSGVCGEREPDVLRSLCKALVSLCTTRQGATIAVDLDDGDGDGDGDGGVLAAESLHRWTPMRRVMAVCMGAAGPRVRMALLRVVSLFVRDAIGACSEGARVPVDDLHYVMGEWCKLVVRHGAPGMVGVDMCGGACASL